MEHPVVIESITQETPIDRTFVLRLQDAEPEVFAYPPGQFVVLTDPAHDEKVHRAYSFSFADRCDGALRITVRDMGDFGAHLYRAEVGTRLMARPPQGRFVLDLEDPTPALLVAGGSGVTPFHAFAEALRAQASAVPCTLIQSARVEDELLFRDSFVELAATTPGFAYVPTLTRAADEAAWSGLRGRIDEALVREHLGDPEQVRFYACGPAAFVKSMLAAADAIGIPKARRHREQWG